MNFVIEWTEVQLPTPDVTHEYWIMYFDGSIMVPELGAGVVLISPDGSRLRYAICLYFSASNHTMEYEALINGLRIAIELGATRLYVRSDLELVVDQVMKESSYKSPSWQHTAKSCASSRTNSRGLSCITSLEGTTTSPIFLRNWLPGGIHPQAGSSSTTSTSRLPASWRVRSRHPRHPAGARGLRP